MAKKAKNEPQAPAVDAMEKAAVATDAAEAKAAEVTPAPEIAEMIGVNQQEYIALQAQAVQCDCILALIDKDRDLKIAYLQALRKHCAPTWTSERERELNNTINGR